MQGSDWVPFFGVATTHSRAGPLSGFHANHPTAAAIAAVRSNLFSLLTPRGTTTTTTTTTIGGGGGSCGGGGGGVGGGGGMARRRPPPIVVVVTATRSMI